MSPEDWALKWKNNQIGFHMETLCEMFRKHYKQLINGRENLKIFIPLCGKAVEMKWLLDEGHSVVGVDCGEEGLQQFFEENKIKFEVYNEARVDGKVYKSSDGRVKLYCCDFYKFSAEVEHDFDAIWDSGALNAINETDQEKYVDICKSIMAKGCVDLIVIDDYEGWSIPVDLDRLLKWFPEGYKVDAFDYIEANDELKAQDIKGQQLYKVVKL